MTPVLRFVRERLVFPILGTKFAQRRLFKKVSQLEVKYDGSLTEFSSGSSSIRAGARAPDVLFGGTGGRVSLFELLGKFGTIALLGPASNNQSLAKSLGALNIRAFVVAPGELEDVYSDFARLYGATGPFLCLIRPDGHVGMFQGEADPAAVADYLKKIRNAERVEKAFA